MREMCAGLEIGRSTLYRHLDLLEIEGWITREPVERAASVCRTTIPRKT